jgi:hypothetical protein
MVCCIFSRPRQGCILQYAKEMAIMSLKVMYTHQTKGSHYYGMKGMYIRQTRAGSILA